ncbi:MAG: hypothetical protein J4F31_11495 [Flavobacteriales bacterium]|nr:hypothetical protein [Flavobacteriales bacterium]
MKWYKIEDAIGLYGTGLNPDGSPSQYKGNIHSKGMAILGVQRSKGSLDIQFWDYYIDNILNAGFIQVDYKQNKWIGGVQYLGEDPHNDGGSEDVSQAYYPPDQQTSLFSFRFGRQVNDFNLTANYTTIPGKGRFLFPREFGREQFYTTIGRGRPEGMGEAKTFMLKAHWIPKSHPELSIEVDAGRTWTPGFENVELNKYYADSYDQYNLDVRYQFSGIWQGPVIRFLYVHNRLESVQKSVSLNLVI